MHFKKVDASINFDNDTISIFEETEKLFLTTSGHYALPIGFQCGQFLSELGENQATQPVFITAEFCDKNIIARKLHRQFLHPKAEKLIYLLKSSGNTDETLFQAIKGLDISCKICKRCCRPSPEPVVGLPMARSFNECVAMDLKEFHEHVWILHFIDHATRFSAGAVIYSKHKEVIVEEIFNSWICIFGPPTKFLSHNGGEFANQDLLHLCEQMNIVVKTTAAESSWSNGLVEQHNAVIGETMNKTLEDTKCSLKVALAWTLHAKNSLSNAHGFSPYILLFGSNPKLPIVLSNKPPALVEFTSSKLIADNLNAIQRAGEAFIRSEASDRIERALRHNFRTLGVQSTSLGIVSVQKRRTQTIGVDQGLC